MPLKMQNSKIIKFLFYILQQKLSLTESLLKTTALKQDYYNTLPFNAKLSCETRACTWRHTSFHTQAILS
jgi:hypothetical protein